MKKTKYHKECGLILNYCEIKINKSTKTVKYTHQEYKVIISSDTHYCVENNYGKLQLVEKNYNKYSSNTAVNKVSVYEQRWNMKSMDDYLHCAVISTFSEKITKTRIKKALYTFIAKEAYFYNGLTFEIEQQLSKGINQVS